MFITKQRFFPPHKFFWEIYKKNFLVKTENFKKFFSMISLRNTLVQLILFKGTVFIILNDPPFTKWYVRLATISDSHLYTLSEQEQTSNPYWRIVLAEKRYLCKSGFTLQKKWKKLPDFNTDLGLKETVVNLEWLEIKCTVPLNAPNFPGRSDQDALSWFSMNSRTDFV